MDVTKTRQNGLIETMATATNFPTRRVLVVEDETDLRELLTYNLGDQGYEVAAAADGQAGWAQYQSFKPHVVLLDVMLPGLSGTEICRRIRAQGEVSQPSIIMLTARGDEIDRVVGFEIGADDYVTKPFSMRELMLRVSAMFRSHRFTGDAPVEKASRTERRQLSLGPLRIDMDGHHLFVDEQEVHVSSLEMRLVLFLMEARGHVRTREQLLSEVWGYKPGVSTRTVDTHIKRLRDKLGRAGDLIETVRGIGYRFGDGDTLHS